MGAFNDYVQMMRGRAEFSAAAGAELLFGFGSKGMDVPYAELYEAQIWNITEGENKKAVLSRIRSNPRLFLPKTSLSEEVFVPNQI